MPQVERAGECLAPLVRPAPTRGREMTAEDRWLNEWLEADGVVLPPAVKAAHRDWQKTFNQE